MNTEKSKDYIFHINWEDFQKNKYRVGFLAELNEQFYFIMSDEQHAQFAYQRGFNGIPGFKPQTIYKSDEIFDFFKQRISNQGLQQNPCEELAKSHGLSMIDSFSLEEVAPIFREKYKTSILEAYQLQKEQERRKAESKTTRTRKTTTKQVVYPKKKEEKFSIK